MSAAALVNGGAARDTLSARTCVHHYNAAVRHVRAERKSEAREACRAALAIDPNYSRAHALLAEIELPGEGYMDVLDRIHAYLRPRTYVEIGLAKGLSLALARPETRAMGVDPVLSNIRVELGANVSLFAQTSDDFFATTDVRAVFGGLPIDLAFIDGMHRFEFALRDFMNIEALAAPDSTILIHDVYPLDEHTARRERATDFWSGDVWRLVPLLRKHRPDLAYHTIGAKPTGLGIVRNLDPRSTYIRDHLDDLIAEYLSLELQTLDGNKAESLALSPNSWTRIRTLLDTPPAARR